MNDIQDVIEHHGRFSTVMLVGSREDIQQERITILTEAGINVIGPVGSAGGALAIAGQVAPDLVLLSEDIARDAEGVDLVRRLRDTWGVRSVTLRPG